MAFIYVPTLEKPSPRHQFISLLNNITFIASRIVYQHLVAICFTSSFPAAYKSLPSIKSILRACHFSCFFLPLFLSHTFFVGLQELKSIFSKSLFMHSLCSLITHSFLVGFQLNLYQDFSHVSSTCHTIFSLK